MKVLHQSAVLLATGDPGGVDPGATFSRFQAWALILVGVFLIVCTIFALLHARSGNVKKTANVSTSVVIALIPLGIAGIGAALFAGDILKAIGVG